MRHTYAHRRKGSRYALLLILLTALLLAGGGWYFFLYDSSTESDYFGGGLTAANTADQSPDAGPLPAGDVGAEPVESAGPAEPDPPVVPPLVIERVIEAGQTAGGMLNEWLSPGEIQAMADACEEVFSLRKLRQGNKYSIVIDDGRFTSFIYEIDRADKLIVTREGPSAFSVCTEPIEYISMLATVEGTITSNLFQTVTDAGEQAGLAMSLADIFAWEINFIRDIQPGDSFSLVVEKRYRDGEFKGYGRIRSAIFTNKGTAFEAFFFFDPDGRPEYFTSSGESVKRAFLKAPLSFTRISSTFTNARLHPIHKVWRAHPGIDYAAPSGTPVKAVGNGTVTYAGWGNGAGNYIALRHNNGYETMYLHLSGFASITKKGAQVAQGDIIGYVGSTGDSTGPHLDFRMKKNGVYVNPLVELTPRSEPVDEKEMPEFSRHVAAWREYLDGTLDPFYSPPTDSILAYTPGSAHLSEQDEHSEQAAGESEDALPAPAEGESPAVSASPGAAPAASPTASSGGTASAS